MVQGFSQVIKLNFRGSVPVLLEAGPRDRISRAARQGDQARGDRKPEEAVFRPSAAEQAGRQCRPAGPCSLAGLSLASRHS